ncbi:hypothetical protein E8E14_005004 [Neopestalotiopsis sp. 37M]|nr:hypothetical protein E8E14_005004 [Neopestalotiopsis sp. 37M]
MGKEPPVVTRSASPMCLKPNYTKSANLIKVMECALNAAVRLARGAVRLVAGMGMVVLQVQSLDLTLFSSKIQKPTGVINT